MNRPSPRGTVDRGEAHPTALGFATADPPRRDAVPASRFDPGLGADSDAEAPGAGRVGQK
jgi:hypothetical protein